MISKKSHNAINIISAISVVGITIGTMALVIVLSAFNGLSDLVQSLYNSFDADIRISAVHGKTFDPSSQAFQSIKNMPGVLHFNEVVEGNALLKLGDKQTVATVKGVMPDYNKMNGFDSLVQEGNYNLSKNNLVLGIGLSYVLDARANDPFSPISIYAPKRGDMSSINPEDGLNELKMYASGFFAINDEFDYKYVLMDIQKARSLLDYTNEVTAVELGVLETDLPVIQKQIQDQLGNDFYVKNKEEQNALLYKTLRSEKLWTFIILVFILVIATFNVIGSLTMLIIEKKKDITTLHSMGADRSLIQKIFLTEGMLITFVGLLTGLLLGVFVCWLQIKFSLIQFSEGYVVNAYPIKVELTDLLLICLVVLMIGFFAAWYPVR
ncbi:MAG: FtsX-like permease family protein, partial [Bacteroidia bacterium]|nr:FtsX-like permease family protein [Bacteroidia bacterium]